MTTPRTPAAGLLILIPLLAGCGGGGGTTPNPRPNVAAVTPSGVAGVAGSTVTFRATVNNSPTSWTWTFDTGVEPANSTAPSPTVALTTAGTHQGHLTVCNAAGCADEFDFTFTVQPPVGAPTITGVTPAGTVGTSATQVEFTATVAGEATSWDWDFGAGVVAPTATSAQPTVTLGLPGTYAGQVVASNAAGDSAPFSFTYTVGAPASPTFPTPYPVDGRPGTHSQEVDIEVVGGIPYVAFYDGIELNIARGNNPDPGFTTEWTTHVANASSDDTVQPGWNLSLTMVGGKLAVAHVAQHPTLPTLRYTRALVDQPAASGDWVTHNIDTLPAEHFTALVERDTRPVIVAGTELVAPRVYEASSPTPATAADWASTPVPGGVDGFPHAGVAAGRLHILLHGPNGLVHVLGSDSVPVTWTATTLSGVPTTAADLVTHLNAPAYIAAVGQPTRVQVGLARSSTPATATDWSIYELDSQDGAGGQGVAIVSLDGRLAVGMRRVPTAGNPPVLGRALIPSPTARDHWQFATHPAEAAESFGIELFDHPLGIGTLFPFGNRRIGYSHTDTEW